VNGDRLVLSIALRKIVALEHAATVLFAASSMRPAAFIAFHPARIEIDGELRFRVEDLEILLAS